MYSRRVSGESGLIWRDFHALCAIYAVTVHDRPEVLSLTEVNKLWQSYTTPLADPDFELRRGAGSILLAQPAFLPLVISFFSPKIRGVGWAPRAPPLDPPLDSCCAQMCILLAFTKAIDLKIHLSLTCEPTISQQKHFSRRISPPATHQGSVKVSSTAKHLGCFELTFHENTRQLKSRLHERGYPDTLVNKVLSEVKFGKRKSALDSNKKKNYTTQQCLI